MKRILTALGAIVLIVILILGVLRWQAERQHNTTPESQQPTFGQEQETEEQAEQGEFCTAAYVISAPGTWESAADDDPLDPQANPNSFLLKVTNPLKERFAGQDVTIWTLPYTAQFRNINAQQEMSYDESRQEGTDRLNEQLRQVHAECPQTKFIVTGFSQGAVIVGDIAHEIGNGNGAIPADSIAGMAVVADGRRVEGLGQTVGNPVAGVGAEVALEPLSGVIQPIVPGATMRGEREGGFGELNDRVFEICAPDDTVCDAPRVITDAFARARDLVGANGVHALYAENPNVIPGTTTNAWLVDWIGGVVDDILQNAS